MSTAVIISCSSFSVGFCPRDLIRDPSSSSVILSSESLSNMSNASLNSGRRNKWRARGYCYIDLPDLSITNAIDSSKIYDKRDDFYFEIVNFPFLGGDVPRSPSYGVFISQLIRFARVCSNVEDFNNRDLFLTAKLLKQGYRLYNIRKAFSKFYHRHSE